MLPCCSCTKGFRERLSFGRACGVNTQLEKVTKSFETVAKAQHHGDIPMEPLLDACHTFLSVLHKTGPGAVARDFSNNLKKVESAYHRDHTRTVTAFLKRELDSGIHHPNSSLYLRDPSGAIGLLWIRRTLAFQTDLYEQVLDGRDTKQAALHAYGQELKPYHGWALRRFYTGFLSTRMPSRPVLLAKVGGYHHHKHGADQYEKQTLEDLQRLVGLWRPLLRNWKQRFVELGMEDTRTV